MNVKGIFIYISMKTIAKNYELYLLAGWPSGFMADGTTESECLWAWQQEWPHAGLPIQLLTMEGPHNSFCKLG